MLAYKVFAKYGDKLKPALVAAPIEYKENCINFRPDGYGPFACFFDMDQALSFKRRHSIAIGHPVIYKVRIQCSGEQIMYGGHEAVIYGASTTVVGLPTPGKRRLDTAPFGTVLADTLELIEETKVAS